MKMRFKNDETINIVETNNSITEVSFKANEVFEAELYTNALDHFVNLRFSDNSIAYFILKNNLILNNHK